MKIRCVPGSDCGSGAVVKGVEPNCLLLAWNVLKGALTHINRSCVDVIEYIWLGEQVNAERFESIPLEGQAYRVMLVNLLQATAVGGLSWWERLWQLLSRLQYETKMDIPCTVNVTKCGYVYRLHKGGQELKSGVAPRSTLKSCLLDWHFDRLPFF